MNNRDEEILKVLEDNPELKEAVIKTHRLGIFTAILGVVVTLAAIIVMSNVAEKMRLKNATTDYHPVHEAKSIKIDAAERSE